MLVVGTITQDNVASPAGDLADELGGSAAYFALAARHFGPVAVIGSVGVDREEDVRRVLDFADLSNLTVSSEPTYRWYARRETAGGEAVTLRRFTGAQGGFVPAVRPGFAWPPVLFLASLDPAVQLAVLEQAPPSTIVATDSMDIFITGGRDMVEAVVRRSQILFVTTIELELLSRQGDVAAAVAALFHRYPDLALVVVKRGADGAEAWRRRETVRLPAADVQVVDPTGAGDTLAGAFIGRLLELGGLEAASLQDPLEWGIAAASFTIAAPGLRGIAATTRAEIEDRLALYRSRG